MIDNFDELVARCNARRRKRMVRLSLKVSGSLLLVVAAVAAYVQWQTLVPDATPPTAPQPAAAVPDRPADVRNEPEPTPAAAPQAAPKPLSDATTPPPETSVRPEPKHSDTVALKTPLPETPQSPAVEPQAAATVAVEAPKAPAKGALFTLNTPSAAAAADPIKAYEAAPGYETALAVARSYYSKSQYAEAAVWAKKANQLNREAEEAWLLYAKSYYAQGRKSDAIGVLELYLNYKDSKAATELLRGWKRP